MITDTQLLKQIEDNPGIIAAEIVKNLGSTKEIVRFALGPLIKRKLVFMQIHGSARKLYLMDYAAKHNVPAKIHNLSQSKLEQVVVAESNRMARLIDRHMLVTSSC